MNTTETKKRTSNALQTKVKRLRDHPKEAVKVPPVGESKINIRKILNKGIKTPIPSGIKPMLATLVNEPFDNPNWLFEIKWDGYRTIAIINKGIVQLLSRNNKSFSVKYYPVTKALSGWTDEAVIDGEIIVAKESGISDFGSLQNWRSEADGELIYYVFDLLWLRGRSLMELPLSERQALLKEVLPLKDDRIRISQTFPGNGKELFYAARNLGLEGIIAKHGNSPYVPDLRSKSWLKIKAQKRQEAIIGGYTLNEGTGKYFSSLLLAVNDKGKLRYVGKVGTGFNAKMQKKMLELFNPLIITSSPFDTEPDVNEPSRFRPNPPHATAVWMKPELICEVSYTEVTKEGVFRHPSFKGMRTDKKPEEVTLEKEKGTDVVLQDNSKRVLQRLNTEFGEA